MQRIGKAWFAGGGVSLVMGLWASISGTTFVYERAYGIYAVSTFEDPLSILVIYRNVFPWISLLFADFLEGLLSKAFTGFYGLYDGEPVELGPSCVFLNYHNIFIWLQLLHCKRTGKCLTIAATGTKFPLRCNFARATGVRPQGKWRSDRLLRLRLHRSS